MQIELKDVTVDGYPPEDETRVVFLFDGCAVSGWVLEEAEYWRDTLWEGDSDVSHGTPFAGVRYWFVMPEEMWRASLPDREDLARKFPGGGWGKPEHPVNLPEREA